MVPLAVAMDTPQYPLCLSVLQQVVIIIIINDDINVIFNHFNPLVSDAVILHAIMVIIN